MQILLLFTNLICQINSELKLTPEFYSIICIPPTTPAPALPHRPPAPFFFFCGGGEIRGKSPNALKEEIN